MKKIKLNEKDIKNIVSIILEQDDSDEWVKVSPKRYEEIMQYAGYYGPGVAKLPEYIGKKIWITGNLDLSGTPTKSLDNVYYVEGNLTISNTQISNIDNIKVKGHVSDWGTPLRKIIEKRIKNKKIGDANNRREDDEWRLDTGYGRADDEAYAAHAILEFLISDKSVKQKTDKDLSRLVELTEMLENLQEKESEYEEQDKDITDIHADIAVTEDEIEEINNKMDIYHLIPDGEHYGLPRFEIIGYDDLEGEAYCAGTPDDVESAARDYIGDQISQGYDNFSKNFVQDNIDEDSVVDYFRDYYEEDIRNNADVYFNDDDYELNDEQEKRIEEIDSLIDFLNNRLEEIENEIEEPSEYSKSYDEIQERIDALESEKEDMEPEVGEPTEEMIEDKLEEMLNDVRRDPVGSLKDIGIDNFENFINEKEFIESVLDVDGVGIINSYDGDYHSIYLNGEEFYIMRLD